MKTSINNDVRYFSELKTSTHERLSTSWERNNPKIRYGLENSDLFSKAMIKLIASAVYNTTHIGPTIHPGGWKKGSYSEVNVICSP